MKFLQIDSYNNIVYTHMHGHAMRRKVASVCYCGRVNVISSKKKQIRKKEKKRVCGYMYFWLLNVSMQTKAKLMSIIVVVVFVFFLLLFFSSFSSSPVVQIKYRKCLYVCKRLSSPLIQIYWNRNAYLITDTESILKYRLPLLATSIYFALI